jgi:hypothetical protein
MEISEPGKNPKYAIVVILLVCDGIIFKNILKIPARMHRYHLILKKPV